MRVSGAPHRGGKKGAAASPLDGGALTRVGSARRRRGRLRHQSLGRRRCLLSVAAATCWLLLRGGKKAERGEEREKAAENELGFRPTRPLRLLLIEQNGRATVGCDPTAERNWAKLSPGGRERRAAFLAQAQVAAWARGSAREGRVGCEPWAVSGRNSKEQEPSFFFFLFSGKLKM